jgi:hypothetical protein
MKKWLALLIALLLVAFAAFPAWADGPRPIDPIHLTLTPIRVVDGMILGFMRSLVMALAVAALGALVVILLPTQARRVSDTAQAQLAPSLGVGCLTVLVALPLFVLLVAMIVTIPVALVLPVALAAAWLFGWIALGWFVGDKVLEAAQARESLRAPIVAVVLGVLLLAVIGSIPLVGWLFGLGVGLVGLGAVVLTILGIRGYQLTRVIP